MPTGTQGTTARRYHTSQIHYLRKDFTKDDAGVAIAFDNPVPGGSLILKPASGVSVKTAFASQTADVLDIGTATTADAFASDLTLTATGFVPVDGTEGNLHVTVDTVVQFTYTQTGTASTVGAGTVVLAYLPDNG